MGKRQLCVKGFGAQVLGHKILCLFGGFSAGTLGTLGAKMLTSAGVYMAHSWPMETILLFICLERGKIIEEILGRLKDKKA